MRFLLGDLTRALALASLGSLSFAADLVHYSLRAADVSANGVSPKVRVTLTLPRDVQASHLTLIMPRAVPMGYDQQPYDEFVTVTGAGSRSGEAAAIKREDGPRWSITAARSSDEVARIDYEVDIEKMETAILSGGDASRARDGYIALLGLSVFGFVDGLEGRGVELAIAPPSNRADWPVFSTLAPKAPAASGPLTARANDFYDLADSQILMGPGFRVRQLKGSPDLFLAVRAEGPVDEDVMAPLAEQAFAALVRYFDTAPFPHYTLVFQYLKPITPRHTYGFATEHLQSASFGALAQAALTVNSTDRERTSFRYNVAHHIAHAWIPKRCAGEGYFPFRFELAPLIDTIWFSEGFGQYAAADALSDVLPQAADGQRYVEALVDLRFRNALKEMPDFLKRMPLVELSRVASLLYSADFRTGRTVFSRGGLMAREMDETIRVSTKGTKRLRDGLRGLVAWSAREKRPFRIDELPGILKASTGVDTQGVMERWLAGIR
jgi:predicted metalloprotease with PDZ domain